MSKCLIYSKDDNLVLWGDFTPQGGLTAHQVMYNAYMKKFANPDVAFRNIAAVWGGSLKEDGTVEMNSGTLNDIISRDPVTGQNGPPSQGIRSRPDLIPEVTKLIEEGHFEEVKLPPRPRPRPSPLGKDGDGKA